MLAKKTSERKSKAAKREKQAERETCSEPGSSNKPLPVFSLLGPLSMSDDVAGSEWAQQCVCGTHEVEAAQPFASMELLRHHFTPTILKWLPDCFHIMKPCRQGQAVPLALWNSRDALLTHYPIACTALWCHTGKKLLSGGFLASINVLERLIKSVA